MKFSCEKHILQAAAATAARAAAGKSTIPSLEGILIEAGENVKLTGYDLKKGIFTTISADVSEPGSAVINSRLLSEIIRSLPDGIVLLSSDKNHLTTIKCGRSEFSIMGMSAEDFPEIMPVDGAFSITLPQETLKNMINQTIFAVSANESRPVYTGSLFQIKDGEVSVVSVDGYRLAKRRESIEGITGDIEFIVPGGALSDVEKICADGDETAAISVGAKQIGFSFGQTVLISRRLEGEFINVEKSIPASFNTYATVEKNAVQRATERVSLIIDDRLKSPLKCKFSEGTIEFLCVTAIGKAFDTVTTDAYSGADIEIGFNNRYLLDAIKNAPADKLKICLSSPTSPCVIVPEDDSGGFLYMILPVRLRAED